MYPIDTSVETTHVVLPPDTNHYGNAFGGTIMSWMDIIAAICAHRYCKGACVTVCVDELQFKKPIKLGDIVTLKARINHTGTTSMEVGIRVERESFELDEDGCYKHPTKTHCLSGYFTFVALDEQGQPRPVEPIRPRDPIDIKRNKAAESRRRDRLARKSR
jgi:acyl-CoA hydrolase